MRTLAFIPGLLAVCLAGGAHAITVTDVGSATAWNGTTMTCTLGSGTCNSVSSVPSGDYIIVGVLQSSGNDTSGAVTDTAGDTFTAGPACNVGGFEAGARIFYGKTTGLSSSNTIVYTSTGGTPYQGMDVTIASGLATSSVADGSGSCAENSGSATSFPSGSVTPSVAGDLAYGIAFNHAANAMTQSTGFATPPTGFGSNISTAGIGGTAVIAGTTAQNYTPTAASSAGWVSAIMLFKASGAAAPTANCTLRLMGFGPC
jgi:hypothetical protein